MAVRDGYEVIGETVPCDGGADQALAALDGTDVGALPPAARDVVRERVADILGSLAEG